MSVLEKVGHRVSNLSRRRLFGRVLSGSALLAASAAGVTWASPADAKTGGQLRIKVLPREQWRPARQDEVPPELWARHTDTMSKSQTAPNCLPSGTDSAPGPAACCYCPCCGWQVVGTCWSNCGELCGTCGRFSVADHLACVDDRGTWCDTYCSSSCVFCC
jgi:hypothetical protein